MTNALSDRSNLILAAQTGNTASVERLLVLCQAGVMR